MNELSDYDLTIEDLPLWMRPKKRHFDIGFLAVFIMGLFLLAPLIVNRGVPQTYAAQAEMYRIQAVSDSFLDGQFYPRWVWQFNQDTGSPIFTYMAPAPHFSSGLFQALTGSSANLTLRYFIVISTLWGVLSTLVFVRRRWTSEAGVIAAALYLTSPWVLTIAPYWQVDGGLLVASALLPFTLWILDRLLDHGAGLDYALFGPGLAGLLLSENGLGIVLTGLILIWLVYLILVERKTTHLRLVVGAIIFAVLISLAFYIPAVNQLDQLEWSVVPRDIPSETQNFYALPWQNDLISDTTLPYYLGIGSSVLALLACGWWLGASVTRKQRFPALYFWSGVWLGLAVLMLLNDNEILWSPWHAIEPLTTSDLFGLFNFSAVVLVAITLSDVYTHLQTSAYRQAVVGVGILLLLSNLSYLRVPDFTDQSITSLASYSAWEQESGWLSTLPNGHLTSAEPIDHTDTPVFAEFSESLPENSIVTVEDNTLYRELRVYTPRENQLIFHTHDYPGLTLQLDHADSAFHAEANNTALVTTIPAGEHLVRIEFQTTTFHQFSLGISGLALVLLILIGYALENNTPHS